MRGFSFPRDRRYRGVGGGVARSLRARTFTSASAALAGPQRRDGLRRECRARVTYCGRALSPGGEPLRVRFGHWSYAGALGRGPGLASARARSTSGWAHGTTSGTAETAREPNSLALACSGTSPFIDDEDRGDCSARERYPEGMSVRRRPDRTQGGKRSRWSRCSSPWFVLRNACNSVATS
jgi:hypothetical protein